jgi:hypothetical protein
LLVHAEGLSLGGLAVGEDEGDVGVGLADDMPGGQHQPIGTDNHAAAKRVPHADRDGGGGRRVDYALELFLNDTEIVETLRGWLLNDGGHLVVPLDTPRLGLGGLLRLFVSLRVFIVRLLAVVPLRGLVGLGGVGLWLRL